jgi:hypothetical protein
MICLTDSTLTSLKSGTSLAINRSNQLRLIHSSRTDGASDEAFFLTVRRFGKPLLIGLAALLTGSLIGLLLGNIILPLLIECCFASR